MVVLWDELGETVDIAEAVSTVDTEKTEDGETANVEDGFLLPVTDTDTVDDTHNVLELLSFKESVAAADSVVPGLSDFESKGVALALLRSVVDEASERTARPVELRAIVFDTRLVGDCEKVQASVGDAFCVDAGVGLRPELAVSVTAGERD
jgi:hypothetical protein